MLPWNLQPRQASVTLRKQFTKPTAHVSHSVYRFHKKLLHLNPTKVVRKGRKGLSVEEVHLPFYLGSLERARYQDAFFMPFFRRPPTHAPARSHKTNGRPTRPAAESLPTPFLFPQKESEGMRDVCRRKGQGDTSTSNDAYRNFKATELASIAIFQAAILNERNVKWQHRKRGENM